MMKPGELELLILQPTPFCNINCDYCYLPDRGDKSRMTLETVRRAAEFARDIGHAGERLPVLWHVGEPMVIHPDWYRAAHDILSEVLGADRLEFGFQSNGTLLSPEWVDFLARDPRIDLGISIDGPEFIHDAHRRTRNGKGTHARVMRGIKALRDAGGSFGCIAVVTDLSLDYPDEFYDFFAELRPSVLALSPEELEGANRTSSLLVRNAETRYSRFLRRVTDLWLKERPFRIREFAPIEAAQCGHSANVAQAGSRGAQLNQQSAPWRVVSVDCRGEVHTFSPELLGTDLPGVGRSLGNVHADSWSSVSASSRFLELLEAIDAGNEKCRSTCTYFEWCGGGAPSNKWFEHRSFSVAETMFCRFNLKAVHDVYFAARDEFLHVQGRA